MSIVAPSSNNASSVTDEAIIRKRKLTAVIEENVHPPSYTTVSKNVMPAEKILENPLRVGRTTLQDDNNPISNSPRGNQTGFSYRAIAEPEKNTFPPRRNSTDGNYYGPSHDGAPENFKQNYAVESSSPSKVWSKKNNPKNKRFRHDASTSYLRAEGNQWICTLCSSGLM